MCKFNRRVAQKYFTRKDGACTTRVVGNRKPEIYLCEVGSIFACGCEGLDPTPEARSLLDPAILDKVGRTDSRAICWRRRISSSRELVV